MKYSYAALMLFILSPLAQAEERVKDISVGVEPITVTATAAGKQHLLFELPEPGISASVYALKGMVRYDNVEGVAFLQMDSYFGEKGTFFSKSLAPSGPLGNISGSADWRPFVLPFYATGGEQADGAPLVPEKLTLSLYLPGSGTVSIRDVALFQYAPGEDPLQASGQWFSNRSAGMFGGIGGGLLGVWGALISVLSARGKARAFVLGSANLLVAIGIASLIGGVVALATSQPYAVYYTLLLIGVIVTAVVGKLRSTLAARYEQLELQRMQAMDAQLL